MGESLLLEAIPNATIPADFFEVSPLKISADFLPRETASELRNVLSRRSLARARQRKAVCSTSMSGMSGSHERGLFHFFGGVESQ